MNWFEILLSAGFYMVAHVVVTEYVKKWINVHPLILSWILGIIVLTTWYLIFGLIIDPHAMHETRPDHVAAGFIVLTGATNTAYRFTGLKRIIKKWLGNVGAD